MSRGNQTVPPLADTYLHHDGYPGVASTFILSHVDGSLGDWFNQTDIKPDVVLLDIGTNDQFNGLTSTQTTTNITSIVDQFLAKRPYGHIFVMPPYNAGSDSSNASLNAFLADVRTKVIAALTGHSPRCHLAGTPTIPDGDFVGGSTGLHCNTAGYALVVDDGSGNGWKPALIAAGF